MTAARAAFERAAARLGIAPQALGVALATAAFIAISVWWLLYDKRPPAGGDPADHLATTMHVADLLRSFDLGGLLEVGYNADTDRFYPPLVPLVGSFADLLGLRVEDWGLIFVNLVFVPMLSAGTYLAGRRIYGATAGLLAALFALGTPIVGSLFHVFLLDAPLAAAVAAAFAALLATEGFERRGPSIAFGALVAAGLLVKTIAPVYLAGPVLVVLARGGWRQWRNLALAAAALLVIAGPYYAANLHDVFGAGKEATISTDITATGAPFDRDSRISFDNLTYYGWAAINEQYYVPLLALFAAGAVMSLREIRQRIGVAEALAGIVVAYLSVTILLGIRDPRYTLPLLVFVAVISTGWIATATRSAVRVAGVAVLGCFVAINVATSMVGWIPTVRLEAPGTNFEFGIDTGTFTFVEDRGYWVGPPQPDPFWHDLFTAAEEDDLMTMRLYIREQPAFWATDGKALAIAGEPYGLREVTVNEPRPWDPADLRISIWADDSTFVGEKGLPEPCAHIEEGAGLLTNEPITESVLVERRTADGFERWCDF